MSGPPDPWTADRDLDTAGAARAIREALPEFSHAVVRPLGEGWDFDTYEVDERWVFRFPRREGEQARLRRDLTLLPWLGQRVGTPVPHYRWGALSARSFPYVFSGYEKLPGVSASALDPQTVDLRTLGTTLGAGFRTLHELDPPAEVRAVLTVPAVTFAESCRTLKRYLPTFVKHADGPLAARATRFFEDPALRPAENAIPRCLVHDDLHAEHILVDPQHTHRVTGWIDWSDACITDPASDFATMYPWGGEDLLQAMVAAYGQHDAAFVERARFRGLCSAFIDFDHWARHGRQDAMAWTLRVLDVALP